MAREQVEKHIFERARSVCHHLWWGVCVSKCDIPASWLLPEHRVSCSEQGAAPAGSPSPVDQAGEPTARGLVGRRIPPRWLRWPCRRFLHAACGTWFPASMHRKRPARRAAALPLRTALTQRWQGKSRSGVSFSKLKDSSIQIRFPCNLWSKVGIKTLF